MKVTLTEAFPDGRFERPANASAIAAVQSRLGVVLPTALRSLYEECNGFREPKGNCPYLAPLGELERYTRFMWGELQESVGDGVSFPDFEPFVFFGTSISGGFWGIRHTPPYEVIHWDAHMLDEGPVYDELGTDIIEVMSNNYSLYDDTDESV